MRKLECKFCKWTWVPRVETPVKCPACQRRNYLVGKVNAKPARRESVK